MAERTKSSQAAQNEQPHLMYHLAQKKETGDTPGLEQSKSGGCWR